MSYYFSKILPSPFEEVVQHTIETLKLEGFGIITQIDVKETLRVKLNQEFRPYRILGACIPGLAYEALKLEDKIGTMLPCNVIVQDAGSGNTEVAAIDPVASMQAVANPQLLEKAKLVREKLKRVIDAL
ncbi:conserved hypothetical protein [Syntrophobacter sp. SbD1]|nr:conserved hypothetical protein [Syntrophobacter sp. SbD1]